jgi:HD-GYP domain-containing protein (c-di-GMP phosphodiesterase class II)
MLFYVITDDENKHAAWSLMASSVDDLSVIDLRSAATLRARELGLIFDIDLRDVSSVAATRFLLGNSPCVGPYVFVCDLASRRDVIQANSLSATDVIERPLDSDALNVALRIIRSRPPEWRRDRTALGVGLTAASDVFDMILRPGRTSVPLDREGMEKVGEQVMAAIATNGVRSWIEAVKAHHSATFRHCLLVNGIAVAFGMHMGLARNDVVHVAVASTLHDVGKAKVPLHILDKPGALMPEEFEQIKLHPGHGRDMAVESGGFDDAVIDAILHHHEYLDGTGYPDGLSHSQVADLTRIITIVDIFAALIEERVYRAAMPFEKAFSILESMDGKLDKPLVRAFRPVALESSQKAASQLAPRLSAFSR